MNQESHGSKARQKYKLNYLITDAANGFLNIFRYVAIYEDLLKKYKIDDARIILFLTIMQNLDDTNLVHRGGPEGLNYAKLSAANLLTKQNNLPQLKVELLQLHNEFISRNLSPGGCADVFAAILFLFSVKQQYFRSEA